MNPLLCNFCKQKQISPAKEKRSAAKRVSEPADTTERDVHGPVTSVRTNGQQNKELQCKIKHRWKEGCQRTWNPLVSRTQSENKLLVRHLLKSNKTIQFSQMGRNSKYGNTIPMSLNLCNLADFRQSSEFVRRGRSQCSLGVRQLVAPQCSVSITHLQFPGVPWSHQHETSSGVRALLATSLCQ